MNESASRGVPAGPAPGWYVGPSGIGDHRYWDGLRWTHGVSRNGVVWEAPLPPDGHLRRTSLQDQPGLDADLPSRALGLAIAGMAVGIALALAFGFAVHQGAPHHRLAGVIASQVGLWIGLIGAPVIATRRYGTGHLLRDFGLRFRWVDAPIGLGVSVAERMATTLVIIPIVLTSKRLAGANTRFIKIFSGSPAGVLAIILLAVVGAPLIEELFFRGLVFQSLRHRLTPPLAITGQAVLFGAAHFQPVLGWGNVAVIAGVTAFGVIQGVSVTWFRRLGPNVWAHACFNAVAVALVLALNG